MKTNNAPQKITVFTAIYKNFLWIIVSAILTACIALGVCSLFVKPTYTASQSLMLTMDANVGNESLSISLAKRYLPTIEKIITSKRVVDVANEKYVGDSVILSQNVRLSSSGEESLIFNINYTDSDPTVAKNKLNALLESAEEELPAKVIGGIELVKTEREQRVVKNTYKLKYTVYGGIIGGGGSLIAFVVIYYVNKGKKEKK